MTRAKRVTNYSGSGSRSVAEVARVLTPGNESVVLARIFYLSREDAKLLSAEHVPREVVSVREVVTSLDRPAPLAARASSTPELALVAA
jgi:hypothetical protein